MKKFTSEGLRESWIKFYEERGHKNIGAVSLIGDGTTGVMFNVAGMQPLMPYLLGKKHPMGTRLCNVQGCVRTLDIEEVGDESHLTFFEMMGNWSLGDYFKKEKTAWSYELLTKVFGLDGNKICSTVFAGNESAPRDDETANLLLNLGIKKENIYYLGKKPNGKENNWWELEGTVGTPCGPDNEWFYPLTDTPCSDHCDINCKCGRYVEIGNDVYMQYKKTETGYEPLDGKNVDTGFGFERLLMFLNGLTDVYKTDLFADVIKKIEELSGEKYGEDAERTRQMRIVADHIRTATMLIGDEHGIVPSNVGAGYVLRRLLRRAIQFATRLKLPAGTLATLSLMFIDKYKKAYPNLALKQDYIIDEINKEEQKFEKTLEQGLKEFQKVINGLIRKKEFIAKSDPSAVVDEIIPGKTAFRLYETFGFPLEMTIEMAGELGYTVDKQGYDEAYKAHQELARAGSEQHFKGGLAETNEITTRMHTATHLMLAGLRKVLGDTVYQRGSNTTTERIRFDFSYDKPMTKEQIAEVEKFVNDAIAAKIDVEMKEVSLKEAKEAGAMGIFDSKYGDRVKTYKIGDLSYEICGGPHVKNTAEIGKFVITKEQSSSAGVRRIRAELR